MLTIDSKDLETLEAAAVYAPPGSDERAKALAIIAKVRGFIAPEELLDEARQLASAVEDEEDQISFDDEASTSPSDDGTFVQCWFWVPNARCEECDKPLAEGEAGNCAECGCATCKESIETRCAPCDECGAKDEDDSEDEDETDAVEPFDPAPGAEAMRRVAIRKTCDALRAANKGSI